MPPRRRAILLLPTPQGLCEYDVLEEAVFLGPAPERGLAASPSPFREAKLALTWNGTAFEVRALPGEAPPDVNGKPFDGAVLADGDRVKLGDQVALYRAVAVPRPTPAAPRRPAGPRRVGAPARRGGPWATALMLFAGLLLLAGAWRAVEHLRVIQGGKSSGRGAPEPPALPAEGAAPVERAARDFEALRALERERPDDLRGAIDRWRDFATSRHPGTPEAESAAARIRELTDAAGIRALGLIEEEAKAQVAGGDFETPLGALRAWERSYGWTAAAPAAAAFRETVRVEARAALDKLLQDVGPWVATNPRKAHAALVGTRLRLPPDLASEVAALIERTDAILRATGRAPAPPEPPAPVPTNGGKPRPPPREPPTPTPRVPPQEGPTPPGPTPPAPRADEPQVVAAWRAARGDLLAGKWSSAQAAYAVLLRDHAASETVRSGRTAIEAGLRAADVGVRGPVALLSVAGRSQNGRVEAEWTFDDATVLAKDFTTVKPFPSDLPEQVDAKDGVVRMSGASGLFLNLVFTSDVRLEADVLPDVARDFGMLALEDSDRFRALLFDVANTQFKLKKGDAARVQPGHVLWFMGEGAWAAADAGVHGFIKIAEKTTSKLVAGEAVKLEFERKKDRAGGAFTAKSDDVRLEGTVKGDDGRGMEAAQVGLFTNGGTISVRRVSVSGVVDERWFRARLQELVALDPGPR